MVESDELNHEYQVLTSFANKFEQSIRIAQKVSDQLSELSDEKVLLLGVLGESTPYVQMKGLSLVHGKKDLDGLLIDYKSVLGNELRCYRQLDDSLQAILAQLQSILVNINHTQDYPPAIEKWRVYLRPKFEVIVQLVEDVNNILVSAMQRNRNEAKALESANPGEIQNNLAAAIVLQDQQAASSSVKVDQALQAIERMHRRDDLRDPIYHINKIGYLVEKLEDLLKSLVVLRKVATVLRMSPAAKKQSSKKRRRFFMIH